MRLTVHHTTTAQAEPDEISLEGKNTASVRRGSSGVIFIAALALAAVSGLSGAFISYAIFHNDKQTGTSACEITPAVVVPDAENQSDAPGRVTAPSEQQSPYDVKPGNIRLYVNGEHRRPTDPATAQEISAAQTLLFGSRSLLTLSEADDLRANPLGWAAAEAVLAPSGRVDPASVVHVGHIIPEPFDPTNAHAKEEFLAQAKATDFPSAQAWLQQPAQRRVRRALRWWHVHQIASAVPEREHVVEVERAIEAGASDYPMRRLVHVKMSGGGTRDRPQTASRDRRDTHIYTNRHTYRYAYCYAYCHTY